MLFAFGKAFRRNLLSCIDLFELLKKEIHLLNTKLFESTDNKFRNNLSGPPTVFYFVSQSEDNLHLERELADPTTDYSTFLQTYVCAKGVKYQNLPRSSIDNRLLIVRHPSYYFFTGMSEKFLIFPMIKEIDTPILIRTIDIFSSIEYYYTRFTRIIAAAGMATAEIDNKARPIFPLLKKVRLPLLSLKETRSLLIDITSRFQELLGAYPKVDKVEEEAEHMYGLAMDLIDGIVSSSAYSQLNEKRLSPKIEGVAESIGKEFNKGLSYTKGFVQRYVGRSYNTISNVSSLIRAHCEFHLNITIVDYTRKIKNLTILIAILTIITTFAALSSIPRIMDILKNLLASFGST